MSRKLIEPQKILALYRQIIKLHQTALPKSQLAESNRAIRGMFDDYTFEIEQKLAQYSAAEQVQSDGNELASTEKTESQLQSSMDGPSSFYEEGMDEFERDVDFETEQDPRIALEMVLARAHNYIRKLQRLVVNGKVANVSSPEFWSTFYASLADQYRDVSREGGSAAMTLEEFFDKHANTMDRDWYCGYNDFVKQYLPVVHEQGAERNKMKTVLIVGNGVSHLPLEIWKSRDFGNLIVTDISTEACKLTEQMLIEAGVSPTKPHKDPVSGRYTITAQANDPQMQVIPCDVLDMPFPDGTFDLIIDKGTIDCLYLSDMYVGEEEDGEEEDGEEEDGEEEDGEEGEGKEEDENKEMMEDWEDEEEDSLGAIQIAKYQREVSRVLKRGGLWAIFSGYELEMDLNHPDAGEPLHLNYDHDKDRDVHVYLLEKSPTQVRVERDTTDH